MIIGVPQGQDDPLWREAQLRELGVTEAILLASLSAGLTAAGQCTDNHPRMAPWMFMYLETFAKLSEQLGDLGWTHQESRGFSTVVRPDRRVAIAVASGNDGTGDLSAEVTTRSAKGSETFAAVAMNLVLPLDARYEAQNERIVAERPEEAELGERVITTTWFLLHDRRGGRLFSELSRPRSIERNGYADEWVPRIPLASQPLDRTELDTGGEPPFNPIVPVVPR